MRSNPSKITSSLIWAALIRVFETLVFPVKCLKCGVYMEEDSARPYTLESCFCENCMKAGVYPMSPPICAVCGIRFQSGGNESHVCGVCLKTPLKLGRIRSVAEYKGVFQDGIQLFKYHSKLSIAKTFEHLLFQAFLQYYENSGIDLIIPMPLHRAKMRKRGFNQAYFLARNFKKLYQYAFKRLPSWEIDLDSLVRIKKTLPQTGFNVEERKRNLHDAFKTAHEDRIRGKHILLIDDVCTTGATCNEAAATLLASGAEQVDALVLARA